MMFMAGPLLLQYFATYGINIVSLAFVGHIGKQELAAAALGTSLVGIVGRTVVVGLCGALDTLASQSAGAGNTAAIATHWRRTVAYLLLHAVPLSAILAAAPLLLRKAGEAELGDMAGAYIRCMLPTIFLECFNRPTNSVLVAQRITAPQMSVTLVVFPLHVATNYLLIHRLGMGYLGAAVAYWVSQVYSLVLMGATIVGAGWQHRVWGGWSTKAHLAEGWRDFAKLAYPACFMRCAESWGFSIMTLAAGKLPDPGTAVAASSIAFNLYGILFMCFAAFSMTACATVGNALGAGSAKRARISAWTALSTAPVMWVAIAALLLEPHTQRLLCLVFTDGSDPVLMYHLRRMLLLVAALELFDGSQVIMTGVIQGAGKQRLGVVVNVVAFYVFAIPVALLLGFWAGLGTEGMYAGMALGPAIQAAAYSTIIYRLDWGVEARAASARARASAAADAAAD